MKFRKKPVVIEAVRYEGGETTWHPALCLDARHSDASPNRPHIDTLEGAMIVSVGDWIITGVAGECYPCKPDIFAATYDPVEETGT